MVLRSLGSYYTHKQLCSNREVSIEKKAGSKKDKGVDKPEISKGSNFIAVITVPSGLHCIFYHLNLPVRTIYVKVCPFASFPNHPEISESLKTIIQEYVK